MKKMQLFVLVAAFGGTQLMHANSNVGKDVLYGVGVGATTLGVFYSSQSYLNQTEGAALAISGLSAVVLSAVIQAANKGSNENWLATFAAALVAFGLGKYIYEQNQEQGQASTPEAS